MTRKEWQWGVLQFPMLSKTFTMLLDQQRETYILSIWYPKHCKKRVQFCKLREIPLPIGGTVVILCKHSSWKDPFTISWYCCDPPKIFFWRDPITIFMVLLWSSSRPYWQLYHVDGVGISPKEYFRRITAIPWKGKGISPRWMFAEDHSNTMKW